MSSSECVSGYGQHSSLNALFFNRSGALWHASYSRVRLICFAALFLLLACVASAQSPPPYDPTLDLSFSPSKAYSGADIDTIDLDTGSLQVKVPLVSFPQRGGILHLDFWIASGGPGDLQKYTIPLSGGRQTWMSSGATNFGNVAYDRYAYSAPPTLSGTSTPVGTDQSYYQASITESDGSSHLVGWLNSVTNGRTVDGSGFQVNNGAVPYTITDQNGVTTTNPGGSGSIVMQDPNGNQITYSTTWPNDTITDTTGRQISAPVYVGLTYPGVNGSSQTIAVTQPTLTQSIYTLPNGTSYSFQYTVVNLPLLNGQTTAQKIAELTSVTLPTGGTVSWTYSPTPAQSPCPGNNYYFPVINRIVNANDGTGVHEWQYQYSLSSTASGTTTVTDPLGNKTVYTYGLTSCAPYPTQVQTYDSNGTLLQTTTNIYSYIYPEQVSPPYLNVNKKSVTTTASNGNQSQVSMTYDRDNGVSFQSYTLLLFTLDTVKSYENPTNAPAGYIGQPWTVKETDYGNGTTGPVLRQTNTTYMAFNGPNASSYFANNLLTKPYSVQVQDGGGTQRAYTTYGYDEVGLQSSGITEQKVTGESYPGNQTSVHRWLSNGSAVSQSPCNVSVASGGYLVTNNIYFDTGEIQKSTDPCLYPTSYLYSSTYYGAYPTTVTNALGQATTLGYDFNTGSLTSVIDPNSKLTTRSYDIMGRPTGIAYPDGGSMSYCYTDIGGATCTQASSAPYSTVTTQAISTAVNKISTSISDGLGRVSTAQLNSDPGGTTTVANTYDALGRAYTVSNPYRSVSDPTYGITTYTYDALGRPIKTLEPDGNILQWCYNGVATTPAVANCTSQLGSATGTWVDSTDESGNHWQRTSDGLGRLTEVMEPSGTAQPQSTLAPSMETDYGFNALNNLLSVKQWGGASGSTGARVRTFSYDSLSRLNCASNPENSSAACPSSGTGTYTSGTTGYTYDADGNVLTKTDARGVVSYGYDKLNRLLSKSYSDGATPSSCYQYDSSSTANSIGRLSAEWTQVGTCPGSAPTSGFLTKRTFLAYDAMGRVLGEQRCTPNLSGPGNCTSSSPTAFALSYFYDLAGDPTAYTNGVSNVPGVGSIAFGLQYDGAGRLQNLSSSWNPAAGSSGSPLSLFTADPTNGYSAFGSIQNVILGDSIFVNKTYDNRLRTTGETATHP